MRGYGRVVMAYGVRVDGFDPPAHRWEKMREIERREGVIFIRFSKERKAWFLFAEDLYLSKDFGERPEGDWLGPYQNFTTEEAKRHQKVMRDAPKDPHKVKVLEVARRLELPGLLSWSGFLLQW